MAKTFDGYVYRDMTPEEESLHKNEMARITAEERRRSLTQSERLTLMFRQNIQTLKVDDQTALRMSDDYPVWDKGLKVAKGDRYRYKDKLYKVLQGHTTQADWTPDIATSMWTVINEEHDGSEFDPIPYGGNMELLEGKYYTQNDVVYKCTRSSGQPVYNPLSELIEIYVTEVQYG